MNSWPLPLLVRIVLASGMLFFGALRMEAAAAAKAAAPVFPDHRASLPAGKVPLTMSIKARPTFVHPGAKFEIAVQVRIASGHHLYATAEPHSVLRPATCELTLPPGITATGEWRKTKPVREEHGRLVYVNTLEFHRVLQLAPHVSHRALVVHATLQYQACTDEVCWPPATMEKTITITPSIARQRDE